MKNRTTYDYRNEATKVGKQMSIKRRNTWSVGKSKKIPYPDANIEINKQTTAIQYKL